MEEQHPTPSFVISLNEDQDDAQDQAGDQDDRGSGVESGSLKRKGLPPSLSYLSFPSERLGWMRPEFDY